MLDISACTINKLSGQSVCVAVGHEPTDFLQIRRKHQTTAKLNFLLHSTLTKEQTSMLLNLSTVKR
jgi:hypothetical protein